MNDPYLIAGGYLVVIVAAMWLPSVVENVAAWLRSRAER